MTEARMSGRHLDGDAVAPRAGARPANAARRRAASAVDRMPANQRKLTRLGNAADWPPTAVLARTVLTRMASADCIGHPAHRVGHFASGAAGSRRWPSAQPWLWSPCSRLRPIWSPVARTRSTLARFRLPIRTSSAQAPAPRAIRPSGKARPLGGRRFGVPRP